MIAPGDPGWDERWCGYRIGEDRYCRKWRRILPDGSHGKYCHHHARFALVLAESVMQSGSYLLREEVSAKFRAFAQKADLLDLTEELGILKAYLSAGLEHWSKEEEITLEEISWVFAYIERLSNVIGTIVKIRNSTALTTAEIHYVQVAIAAVLKKFIPPDQLRAAMEALFAVTANEHQTQLKAWNSIENGVVEEGEDPLLEKWQYTRRARIVDLDRSP